MEIISNRGEEMKYYYILLFTLPFILFAYFSCKYPNGYFRLYLVFLAASSFIFIFVTSFNIGVIYTIKTIIPDTPDLAVLRNKVRTYELNQLTLTLVFAIYQIALISMWPLIIRKKLRNLQPSDI